MLIHLKDIHKAYGSTVLFDSATALFAPNDKIGMIGRNGSGKTTLCRILLGEEEIDAGQVVRSPQLRLSYLQQKDPFEPGEPVMDFLRRSTDREEWQCGKVAGSFQIKNEMLEGPVSSLSGGYQTRVKLASMLLTEPNFLVLDEPTNYLDLTTQLLLEQFLTSFRGGFLIVSHDREFLKRTCTRTLEVEHGKLTLHRGDVEAYLAYKAGLLKQAEVHNRNVEQQRKHLQNFIDRNRARAATASRAQSKIKQRDRLQTMDIANPIRTTRIRMPEIDEKKGMALCVEQMDIGYGEYQVARDLTFDVDRGERVAVLGDNGEGKTTFLKSIAGLIDSLGGSFEWGYGLELAYYAQHVYTSMDPNLDVYGYLKREAGSGITDQQILDLAGSFLFGGDDVEKPIRVLSGGERSRLCLAGLLLGKRPVLLLDEPTNHLDFETVEALGLALQQFKGTIFFVSHDRTFVNLVATNILDVRDGTIKLYPGDYDAYVYQTEKRIQEKAPPSRKTGAAKKKGGTHHEQKEKRSKINQMKKRVATIEKQMAQHEKEREEIHAHYLAHPTDYDSDKQARLDELNRILPDEEQRWLALSDELDRME